MDRALVLYRQLAIVSVEGRIQDNEAKMAAMQHQIRAMFKVALYSLPKKVKNMKWDEAVSEGLEPRLSYPRPEPVN